MKRMVWNGNELVFDDKPKHGVAGIAPDQPDSLGEEIAVAYNAYFTSSNSDYAKYGMYQCPYNKSCHCKMDEPCKGCETWAAYFA